MAVERQEKELCSDDHKAVVHSFVAWCSRKQLAYPVLLFCEMHIPLRGIAHNLLIFSIPWVRALFGAQRTEQLLHLFSSESGLEYLREQLTIAVDGASSSHTGSSHTEGAHGRS